MENNYNFTIILNKLLIFFINLMNSLTERQIQRIMNSSFVFILYEQLEFEKKNIKIECLKTKIKSQSDYSKRLVIFNQFCASI